MMSFLPQIGYAAAALAFALLTILAATIWRARYDGPALLFATVSTTVWCSLLAHASATGLFSPLSAFAAELVVDIAWLNFVGSLFRGALVGRSFLVFRYGGVAVAFAVLVTGIVVHLNPAVLALNLSSVLVAGSILTAISGLALLEQVLRNGRVSQRRDLRYLVLGLASLFLVDLLLYSDAILGGHINALFWDIRGYIVTMSAVLAGRALALRDRTAPGVFVSRRVVFHTATIVFAGIFLAVVAVAAQLVRYFDQQLGEAAQVVMFSAAAILFILFILSDRYRNKLRVFVATHFFEAKYDYRAEWRQLISTLTSTDRDLPLAKRAIRAMLNIVASHSGVLWVTSEDSAAYVAVSSWNQPVPDVRLEADSALVAFIQRTLWVIDLNDLRAGRGGYEGLDAEDIPEGLDGLWALVPLIHNERVCGIVGMAPSETVESLNFEDHDLLKMAGRQVASFLEQERATARLAETMQFEAFSRLTAYLMHDLKNTMAQQMLIVDNAEKHKRNPDFVDDVIDTVRASAERIRNVVNQLQQGTKGGRRDRIDVGRVVLIATSRCADRSPAPGASLCDARAIVVGDEHRLLMALTHAISNAQDATPADGKVDVTMRIDGKDCVIDIADTGAGMDAEFVRDRLFRPFDSTKGAQGMGIGAHQIRETIREMGGSVSVDSAPGEGTTLKLRIPLADNGTDNGDTVAQDA